PLPREALDAGLMRIEVQELVVLRGGHRAVDRVSFVVEGAGWTGLVGANGSGKTSLLRAIAGRLPSSEGAILLDGADRTSDRAVLLDEPFNWLDPICAFDTKQALGALVAAEGLTLVTALHDMTSLVQHCGAGLLLADGQIRRRLGPEEMTAGRRDYAAFEAEMIAGLRGDRPGR